MATTSEPLTVFFGLRFTIFSSRNGQLVARVLTPACRILTSITTSIKEAEVLRRLEDVNSGLMLFAATKLPWLYLA